MGLFGWDVLSSRETLIGTVTDQFRNGDGDWELTVLPAPGFEGLLVNSNKETNANNKMGCEVEPTDSVDNDPNESFYFSPLLNRSVLMEGAWVEDLSHDNKTEIHPIYSIFSTSSPPGADPSRIEFFAFSDDSANFPAPVPFTWESQSCHFKAPFPPAPADPAFRPTIALVSQLDMAASRAFKVAQAGNTYSLMGEIQTGIAPNQGFYHAIIDLSFAQLPDQQACSNLKDKIEGIRAGIAGLNAAISQDVREGFKPSKEDVKTVLDLEDEVARLRHEAERPRLLPDLPGYLPGGGRML